MRGMHPSSYYQLSLEFTITGVLGIYGSVQVISYSNYIGYMFYFKMFSCQCCGKCLVLLENNPCEMPYVASSISYGLYQPMPI